MKELHFGWSVLLYGVGSKLEVRFVCVYICVCVCVCSSPVCFLCLVTYSRLVKNVSPKKRRYGTAELAIDELVTLRESG